MNTRISKILIFFLTTLVIGDWMNLQYFTATKAVLQNSQKTTANRSFAEPVTITWKELPFPYDTIYDIAVNHNNIYIGSTTIIPISLSNDFGETWSTEVHGLPEANGQSVIIDPLNSEILYAGLRIREGVYRSNNHGVDWFSINGDLSLLPSEVSALHVKTDNPDFIIAIDGPISYRTVNGGINWTIHSVTPTNDYLLQLVTSPHNPSFLYAIYSNHGVRFSSDFGATWEASNISAQALAFDPINPNIIYKLSCDLYKSFDGGNTWDVLTTPQPCYEEIVIDPNQPEVIYLISQYRPVVRSVDGGNLWTTLDKSTTGGYVDKIKKLVIDPVDSRKIYIFSQGDLYVSVFTYQSLLPLIIK